MNNQVINIAWSHHYHETWWHHQMETLSRYSAFCLGNSPVFSAQRPVTQSFDVLFDLHLHKRLDKQSCGWWFEMSSSPLWRHRNDQPSWSWGRNILGELVQYVYCRCPGPWRRQAISSHSIDYVGWANPCLTCGRLPPTWDFSISENYRNANTFHPNKSVHKCLNFKPLFGVGLWDKGTHSSSFNTVIRYCISYYVVDSHQ